VALPRRARDLTVLAVPVYFAAMGAEYARLRRRRAREGPSAGDYERRDTAASLAMGTLSLLAPLVLPRLLRPLALGRSRLATVVAASALGAAVVTTVADRAALAPAPDRDPEVARRVASVAGVAAVGAALVLGAATWSDRTSAERLWRHRRLPSLGSGPVALVAAVAAWDFVYYWNHRLAHESRWLWASHVVHHSSERYNLSTALRQPVTDTLGTAVPYGALCLAGISPALVLQARGVNLLYQFWIHTETIGHLGAPEAVLNSPSHHRVHHGANRRYLDRNHGSILIVWDRLFGTFEPEAEPVVYGLTTNIDTFDPARIATHELAAMVRDVARSTSWADRCSAVFADPGWSRRRWGRPGGTSEAREQDQQVGHRGPVAPDLAVRRVVGVEAPVDQAEQRLGR
jgi:sterol desaturase/sphingolipid hydroxylase (fatty acid hydroxylase superfamily)